MTLAQTAGIPAEVALPIIGSSGYASPMLAFRCALAQARRFKPAAFRLDLMAKDLRLAIAEAERFGAPVPTARAVERPARAGRRAGLGESDAVALLLLLERQAGLPAEGWPA